MAPTLWGCGHHRNFLKGVAAYGSQRCRQILQYLWKPERNLRPCQRHGYGEHDRKRGIRIQKQDYGTDTKAHKNRVETERVSKHDQ